MKAIRGSRYKLSKYSLLFEHSALIFVFSLDYNLTQSSFVLLPKMKIFTPFTGLLIGQAASVLADIYTQPNAASECGALGVMEWNLDSLPANVNLTGLRACKEHPLTLNHEHTPEKRACYWGKKKVGCDGGYCWAQCAAGIEGGWCWLAWQYGEGSWVTCTEDKQCKKFLDTNIPGCGIGDCKDCGCGC